MKKNLLSGIILLLPIAITVFVFTFLIDFLTAPFLPHVEKIFGNFLQSSPIDPSQHHTLFVGVSRLIILILLFVGLIILGFLGQKIFFSWFVRTFHRLMLKIPLIKGIYKITNDIIQAVFSHKKKLISRVVLVPFPSETSSTMGFVTGNAPHQLQNEDPQASKKNLLKSVFIPTSPHPISGLLLLAEDQHLKKLDISVEDTFKFLVSCGIYTPKHPEKISKPPEVPIDEDSLDC